MSRPKREVDVTLRPDSKVATHARADLASLPQIIYCPLLPVQLELRTVPCGDAACSCWVGVECTIHDNINVYCTVRDCTVESVCVDLKL